MSHRIVADVIEHSQAPSHGKLLLLLIAHHAHDDGTHAYCSMRRLSKLSGIALSTVEEWIAWLEANGHLHNAHRQGPNGSNLYTILRPWDTKAVPSNGTVPEVDTPGHIPKSGIEQNRKDLKPFQSQKPVHRPAVHVREPVILTAHDLANLASYGLTNPDWVAELTQQPVHVPGTDTRPQADPGKGYVLGDLCPHGHDWQGTGKSRRRITSGQCCFCPD